MAEISDPPSMSLAVTLVARERKREVHPSLLLQSMVHSDVEKGWWSVVVPIEIGTTKMQLQFCHQNPGGGSAMAQS